MSSDIRTCTDVIFGLIFSTRDGFIINGKVEQ